MNVSVLTTRGPTVVALLVQWSEGTNYTYMYACFNLFTLYNYTLLLENFLKNNISKEKGKIFVTFICYLVTKDFYLVTR